MIHVFGIRHHGPGSAKNLMKALNDIKPDCILVEFPSDAGDAFQFVNATDLTPPVAVLMYDPKNTDFYGYYPFAKFSPEWQAGLYANKHGIPIFPIDLPFGVFLPPELSIAKSEMETDPISYIAKLDGYSDGERWWDWYFESKENSLEVFDVILELMSALREEKLREESEETLVREAYMRTAIRGYLKKGFHNIAIICGAWHAPVLKAFEKHTAKTDQSIIKSYKPIKIKYSWVPWSYENLSFQSGYSAGVKAPLWYELLFRDEAKAPIIWMTKTARLFRQYDQNASTANVTEAVRLAKTLAFLRNMQIPTLEELEEAAIAVFGEGKRDLLQKIRTQNVIGDVVGKVGSNIPPIPLLKDLEVQIKSARLTKEWNSTELIRKDLDLRKPGNLQASHLIRRLDLLGIPWGYLRTGSRFKTGSFSENWSLKRRTSDVIKLVTFGMWGKTIEEATTNFAIKQSTQLENLAELTNFADKVLKANLLGAISAILEQLERRATVEKDVEALIQALPSFVQIIRYGNTRQTDSTAVFNIIRQIIPRIFIGLPSICIQINDNVAHNRYQQLNILNHAFTLLQIENYKESWLNTLEHLGNLTSLHPLLSGFITRLLYDMARLGKHQTQQILQQALSQSITGTEKAQWLEGFLSGNGLILIHHFELWNLINEWLTGLPEEAFIQILPLLRRTFSGYSSFERKKILSLAHKSQKVEKQSNSLANIDSELNELIFATLQILGFKT